MRRVASLFLPQLPIEQLGRNGTSKPLKRAAELPLSDDPGDCSVPRNGHWRPGARWAREGTIAAYRQLPVRELGRRSEAQEHPFRGLPENEDLQVVSAAPPAPAIDAPLVLSIRQRQCEVIHAANGVALTLGLRPGMAVAQARALYAELDIRPADLAAENAALGRLAIHAARHWTPLVAVAAPDGLFLDLTGTSHLFGGEAAFCRRLLAFFTRLRLTARVAITDTPGAAHALARFSGNPITIVAPGQATAAIAPLPLAALRLETGALAAARRFGLERIGDLLPLPRGPLAKRLGRNAIDRLDQAIGRLAEPIDSVVPFEAPVAERRLLEPIFTAEAIAQVMSDLTQDLVDALRARGLGVRQATLAFLRVDGTEQTIGVGLARASRNAQHLIKLLTFRLERIDPGMGIEAGRLTARHTEVLDAENCASVLTGETPEMDIAGLVDRLAGRIGHDALFKSTLVESDVPERAVVRTGPLSEATGWPTWKRPARLLARPEPLFGVIALLPDHPPRRFGWRGQMHDVIAGDGPERIYGEWWVRDGEVWAVRDYYRVEDCEGRRFWLFRRGDGVEVETGDRSWWMHGAFG
ncbi:DNA polymerase Y family protein [Altererythrobacter sp. FM1]|uniref:Y-family DNA polymerase n=1 Tax=Tsuneonella flava TaxID=2055955 RepID=UPI000C7F7AAF|nr:DNA polymerase Y family protein [Tsuneonella flava]ROT97436.1 DNA polymerase Y family protein [Altererythrobacter sp. FM1]